MDHRPDAARERRQPLTRREQLPAGWYPNPDQPGTHRFWDGRRWTGHVEGPDTVPAPWPTGPRPPGYDYMSPPTPIPGMALSRLGRRALTATFGLVLAVVTLGVGYLVWSIPTWAHGQTPAQRLRRMRVVDASTGRPAGRRRMIVRQAICASLVVTIAGAVRGEWAAVAAVVAGVAAAAASAARWSPLRQTLWDRLCRTAVTDLDPFRGRSSAR